MTTSRKKKEPLRWYSVEGHYSRIMEPETRMALAAAAQCDTRTVIRWLRGLDIRPSIESRLDAAAKSLNLYKKKGMAS